MDGVVVWVTDYQTAKMLNTVRGVISAAYGVIRIFKGSTLAPPIYSFESSIA